MVSRNFHILSIWETKLKGREEEFLEAERERERKREYSNTNKVTKEVTFRRRKRLLWIKLKIEGIVRSAYDLGDENVEEIKNSEKFQPKQKVNGSLEF